MDTSQALKKPCPDCYHAVRDHDFMGCTLGYCNCRLTGPFLIEYFKAE
jgi:hypothetical protein